MDSIEKLKNLFSKFPTVGKRSAGRFVYYLVRQPKESLEELINAINDLKNNTKLCKVCFLPFESQKNSDICEICQDARRNKNLLCIVEKEADLLTIENTKKYNGLYFILGGTIGTLRREDVSQLRLEQIKERVAENNLSEIIIAINPTPEGKTTSVLIEKIIKDLNSKAKITHLAQGIPVGGELEYADEETLQSALEGRK